MDKSQFSFKKGYMQVKLRDVKKCRQDLMAVFGITTRAALVNRINGAIEPKISEVKAVERVFAGLGIKDVWGDA